MNIQYFLYNVTGKRDQIDKQERCVRKERKNRDLQKGRKTFNFKISVGNHGDLCSYACCRSESQSGGLTMIILMSL